MKTNKAIKALRKPYTARFYRGNKGAFAVAALVSLAMGAVNLVLSWLLQQVIDTMSGVAGALRLDTLAVLIAAFLGLIVLVQAAGYYAKPRFMEKAMRQYKDFAFEKLTQKSIASFKDEATATYISALSNDATSIETNYLEKQFAMVMHVAMFFGAFGMMIVYNPLLTLVAVLLSILPVIASLLAGNRLELAEKQVSERNEGFVATLKDSLSGFSVVKSFKAEQAIIKLFASSSHAVEGATCRRRKIATVLGTIGSVAGAMAQLGVFLAGAWLALSQGNITPGVVLVFVNLMNFVIQPIAEMPGILAGRKAARGLIDKLAQALDLNVRDEGVHIPKRLHEGIAVNDLSFAYEKGQPVLDGLSAFFEAGKSYAIVGASGSGKSTLLNLLMAAHNNYEGSIRYDDQELWAISSQSLYDLVSIIQQDVFVFNASIRDNITMFSDFPVEAVDRAIAQSGLSEMIKVRGEGYLCGENGAGLSGGERQRLSIARSLLRETPVLLVDEATAALDQETAYHVMGSILALQGFTRIVVTHALEEGLLRQYDRILTLKGGRLIEQGDFETLMAQKGYFYSLYTVAQ